MSLSFLVYNLDKMKGFMVYDSIHFHKADMPKSRRRGLINLGLSPAVFSEEVFKDILLVSTPGV